MRVGRQCQRKERKSSRRGSRGGGGSDSDVVTATAVASNFSEDFSIERNRVIVFVVRNPRGHES